jgi:transcriptional regulator with XRE-family HTH domain
MARPASRRERKLAEFGESLRTWRKIQRLPMTVLAERAGITRDTLRAIESGAGSVRLENVFAVMEVLGVDPSVLEAVDPAATERGRALLENGLPERVRR